ncbi:polysaccharide biosynthesis tyrosine autokinase [Halovibrio sp. HP20-50]|uniref:polysaccharide biosynthesis tyrosine autokinase n=1 Tax=Halovibrio sp. HP20-59 TaxID=3080275 RepID=UPI00294B78EF|nr:polysaccharide biosynthesis tyrosine autokinase [Halovibrio sp. HP20-59]MEA2120215.1 polysaccharide biosynthesis tyrosine autokinase [Halovibrio sp. HP20-59]
MSDSLQQSTQEETIDLSRLFGALFRRKWLIIVVTLIFAFIGIVHGMLATPVYRADALVQVERRNTVSPLGGVENVTGPAAGEFNTSAELQILQSRMVLGQVVERVGSDFIISPVELPFIGGLVLRRGIPRPDFMAGYPHVWGNESINVARFNTDDSSRGQRFIVERGPEDTYYVMQGDNRVVTGTLGRPEVFFNGGLELTIESFDAAEGAQYVLIRQHKTSAIRRIASRLQVVEVAGGGGATGMIRLMMQGEEPREIIRSLDAVAQTFLTQNIERQSEQAQQSLEFLKKQAPELREQLDLAEQNLNDYRSNLDSVDLSSEAQAAIQRYIELDTRLDELEFQEAELAQRFTPSHPNYQALLRQRRQIEKDLQQLNARVKELPAAQQEVLRRTREVEVTQAIYVNILNKVQELEVARAGTIGNIRIIDNAVLSGQIAPNSFRLLVLYTALGFLLITGYILLRELLKRGIESSEQLESVGLTVYASVPQSSAQRKLNRALKRRGKKASKSVVGGVLAQRDPMDLSLESLRGLRTSLHFTMMDGRNNRIMLTGPSPGVGKSFVSINLGAISAMAGKKVLIIDADLRKGNLHHAFGQASSGGLVEFLSGELTLEDIIKPTGIAHYDVITRGVVANNPSELLMRPGFEQALEDLSEMYDMVIVDTPPVLAVTDACVAGKYCGTTLLVTRFDKNSVREIRMAKKRLEGSGLEIQGAILNGVKISSRGASGYYGYGTYKYQ